MSELAYRERPAAGDPRGLLILHHGRGTDELDLLPLADALDPDRSLHVVSVRAPLTLAGSPGYHWYVVRQVGHPDAATFSASFALLADLHDQLWERLGLEPARTILGGFSMGAVMSYSLGLAQGRPAAAGVLAFSGFLPTVEGWTADFAGHSRLRVFIVHGRHDPTISIDFARAARSRLQAGGLEVSYHEFDGPHTIYPAHVAEARTWLSDTLALA